MLMPSSLLLMSGTLPTEVFKILPVVHSGVHTEEGQICRSDRQRILEKILE